MGDISEYFSREEFTCRCGCGFDTVDYQLLLVLDFVRRYYDAPVHISSAARCINHNRQCGSKDTSQHVRGRAADIQVQGVDPVDVYNLLDEHFPSMLGLGLYGTFVHVDTRTGRGSRW